MPTIADFLTRRVETPLKITSGHRLYYSYHFDDLSREVELANVGRTYAPRDFRTLREKREEIGSAVSVSATAMARNQ